MWYIEICTLKWWVVEVVVMYVKVLFALFNQPSDSTYHMKNHINQSFERVVESILIMRDLTTTILPLANHNNKNTYCIR